MLLLGASRARALLRCASGSNAAPLRRAALYATAAREGTVLIRNTQRSHTVDVDRLERLTRHLLETLDCGAFDVGLWLTTDATVRAVTTATGLLREGGVVTVVAYVGHDGGAEETAAVLAFCATLDPKRFVVSHHVVLNRKNSPQLVAVHRRMNRG